MINFDFYPFIGYAEKNNISLPENVTEQLNIYGNLLIEWNEKINLTAITEPKEIIVKHFIDSLSVLQVININNSCSLIDIGTGAGFPGMVLKILKPELDVTLLDGHAKRFIFLNDLQNKLGIYTKNLHIRAELASKKSEYREKFDFATARAVAKLNVLSEYCLPFVKPKGKFVAMKGPDLSEEIQLSQNAISVLGGKLEKSYKFILPDNSERNIAVIEKITSTPEKYPRASAKISKDSL